MLQDFRYGIRALRANPAFATTTTLTLAVTLALTIGAFTVFNAYVLRPYAVRDPASLQVVAWHARDGGGQALSWSDYEAIRVRTDLFDAVLAASTRYVSSQGRPLAAELVSETYFDGLGASFHLGRPLGLGDQSGAASHAAVLGYQAWERLFARDPAAVGRTIDVNGHSFTIVGVLGPRFGGLHAMPRDIWLPATAYANLFAPELIGADQPAVFTVSVRLRPGVTSQQAQAAVTPLLQDSGNADQQVRAELPSQSRPVTLSLGLIALLSPVFAAFALTLAAGCANVSNAMLARAMTRRREIAIRIAAGASPGRVVRQLLTEGLLIALVATAIAMPLIAWGLQVATAIFLASLPPSLAAILRTAPLEIDARVWLFAVGAGVMSTLAFALVPAWQAARPTPMSMLGSPGGSDRRGSRLRALLVAAQVAISLLLAIPALTLARNGVAMRDIDVGFAVDDVTSIHVREGDVVERVRRLAEVMAADPRFAHVAATNGNPLFGPSRTVSLESQGHLAVTPLMFVSPGYFATLRIAIVGGRSFRNDEATAAAPVAVIAKATAGTFWPGQDPIGKTLTMSSGGADGAPGARQQVTIIGVAGDIIGGTIVEGPEAGRIYLPTSPGQSTAIALLVRAHAARDLAPEALHPVLQRVAADPEVFEALPLADVRALQVYPFIAASWIGSLLGVLALALSISGLIGVLTYSLTQRTRELGVRIALGATARGIMSMVLWQTARLTAAGALAGLAGAFGAMKLLAVMVRFHGVSWLDGVAFAIGLAVVAVAAGLAACHPARRAAQVDPAQILRVDT